MEMVRPSMALVQECADLQTQVLSLDIRCEVNHEMVPGL